MINAIKRLAKAFDKIILDDDVSLRGGCFCETCLNHFEEKYGIPKEQLMKSIQDFDLEVLRKWTSFKCESLESPVKDAVEAAKGVNPKVKVGHMWMQMAGPYHGINPSKISRLLDVVRVGEGHFDAKSFSGDGQIFEYLSIQYHLSGLRASSKKIQTISETTHLPVGGSGSITQKESLKKSTWLWQVGSKTS
ncbi:MAG: hypothetical protein ACUVQY_03125 [Thermoproteota archaeon]